MTPEIETFLAQSEGKRIAYLRPEMTDAERQAASDSNMELLHGYVSATRSLVRELEALSSDRSVGAIWRRAYQRSISTAEDLNRAVKSRRWKAKALGLNPEPLHNALALSGMAPIQFEDRWMLGVAIPQPAPFGDLGFDIEDVVLIDPDSGKASVMADVGATHVGPPDGLYDRLPVLTDAKAWARQIALDRLEWVGLLRERRKTIKVEPTWLGWPSAALLLVAPKKMRWRELSASVLEVPAEMREHVRRAILAEARLPRVEGRA